MPFCGRGPSGCNNRRYVASENRFKSFSSKADVLFTRCPVCLSVYCTKLCYATHLLDRSACGEAASLIQQLALQEQVILKSAGCINVVAYDGFCTALILQATLHSSARNQPVGPSPQPAAAAGPATVHQPTKAPSAASLPIIETQPSSDVLSTPIETSGETVFFRKCPCFRHSIYCRRQSDTCLFPLFTRLTSLNCGRETLASSRVHPQ